jgi:hypothetical protein
MHYVYGFVVSTSQALTMDLLCATDRSSESGSGHGKRCKRAEPVTQRCGHKTASVTLDQYGHLYDDDLDEVARTMGTRCVYPQRVG